jgi:hypothetical protein
MPTAAPHAQRPIRETRFWQAYQERRYAILFYTLLLTLLVIPVAKTLGLPALVPKLLIGAVLCAAVMPNAPRRTRAVFLMGIVLLVVARIASESDSVPLNNGFVLALVGCIGLIAAGKTLEFAVRSVEVTSETLYAALSTYLLGGMFFGQLYWSLEQITPGSLVGPDPLTEAISLYYSFVTLATLGYGDYLPRTDIARGVATFEVIGGQLFLAVMVARLIGLFVPKED